VLCLPSYNYLKLLLILLLRRSMYLLQSCYFWITSIGLTATMMILTVVRNVHSFELNDMPCDREWWRAVHYQAASPGTARRTPCLLCGRAEQGWLIYQSSHSPAQQHQDCHCLLICTSYLLQMFTSGSSGRVYCNWHDAGSMLILSNTSNPEQVVKPLCAQANSASYP